MYRRRQRSPAYGPSPYAGVLLGGLDWLLAIEWSATPLGGCSGDGKRSGTSPRDGDWVKATDTIPCGFGDALVGGGISRGTRGVVVGQPRGFWEQRVTVRFDDGFGSLSEVDAKTCDLAVVRREGGHERFERRANLTGLIRLGVVLGSSRRRCTSSPPTGGRRGAWTGSSRPS